MLKALFLVALCLFSVGADYGWRPYTPGGMGIDQSNGGTRGPGYQFEQHYQRYCGLGCTQYARASDFGTLDRRHLHLDPERRGNRDPEYGENRNPDW